MRLIGRYEITGEVESGGTTFKAFDPATARAVEIRTVDLDHLRSAHGEQAPEQLVEALRLASTLSHPSIAAIYDVLKQDDSIHIVSEFVLGHSLEEMLRNGNLTAATDLVLELRQIAQALDYAHRKGATHGALTPENIIIFSQSVSDGERLAKIRGFGFAALLNHPSDGYMSPEQMNGNAADARSDQFSLAVIVYQLLCGQKPFVENPKPVEELNPSLSESAGKVLTRALARDPQQRFASASGFFGALSIAVAESKHLPETDSAGTIAQGYRPPATHAVPLASGAEERTSRHRVVDRDNEDPLRGNQRIAAGKNLGLVVILLFLLAATLMFIVRMNSGGPIPVQVIETQSAPTTPPPVTKQSVAAPHATPETPTHPRAEQQASARREPPSHAKPELAATETQSNGSRTADVELLTDPPGARIAVDERSDATCHAPCTMTLPVGRHTLTAQLNGYAIAQRIFTAPDTNSLYIQLAQSFGLLVLTSTPAGASILVDGNSYGRTPATLRLSVGVHRITLLYGSQRHDETVNVEAETMQSRNIRWSL